MQRRWGLRGGEGFGILSPSHQACETRFSVFMEMKCLFSTTREAKLWEHFSLRKSHQTLRPETSNVGPRFDVVLVVLCMSPRVTNVSNTLAPDTAGTQLRVQ